MKEKHLLLLQSHFGDAYITHALLDLANNKRNAKTLNLLKIGNDQTGVHRVVRNKISGFVTQIFERIQGWLKSVQVENLLGLGIPETLDSLLIVLNKFIKQAYATSSEQIISLIASAWANVQSLWKYLINLWTVSHPAGQESADLTEGQNLFSIPFADIVVSYGAYYVLPALRSIFYGTKDLVEMVIGKIGDAVGMCASAIGHFVSEAATLTVDVVGSTLYQLKQAAVYCAFFATTSLSEVSQYVAIGLDETRHFLRSQSVGATRLIDELIGRAEKQEREFRGLFDSVFFQPIRKVFGSGFGALRRLLRYCFNGIKHVLFSLSTFLPTFCTRVVDFVLNCYTSMMSQATAFVDYIKSFGNQSADTSSLLVMDVQKLLDEAKKMRESARHHANPDDMRQLVSAIGNSEEWLTKVQQYSKDRHKSLLRLGSSGLSELWQGISNSAAAMTSLYFDTGNEKEEAKRQDTVLNDLVYHNTGRSFEEFTHEYVDVLTSLQSSINLVACSGKETAETSQSSTDSGPTGVRRRGPRAPYAEMEVNLLGCFESREATQEDMRNMLYREAELKAEIKALKENFAYQQAIAVIAQQHQNALLASGGVNMESVNKLYLAMTQAANPQVFAKETELRNVQNSLAWKKTKLDICKGAAIVITIFVVLGIVGTLIYMWYNRILEQNEFQMRLLASTKMQAIEDAAARDPFIMRFTNRLYTEKNFKAIAEKEPLQVLNQFQVELRDFPSKLRNGDASVTVQELDNWGALCLNSFHLQLRVAAKEAIADKETRENSWSNKAKGLLSYFYTKVAGSSSGGANTPAIAAQVASDAVIAQEWLKTSSSGAVSEGVAAVVHEFGSAAELYKMKLSDFELSKFANGVQAYEGNYANYRKHLATLAEMAIAIYDQRFEVYAQSLKPKDEWLVTKFVNAIGQGALGTWNYGAGLVQATGALGPDWAALADVDQMGYQLSRGAAPFIAMQIEAVIFLGYGSFQVIHGLLRILYGAIFLIIGHIFDRHAGTGQIAQEHIYEGGAALMRAGERAVALAMSIFTARLTALTAGLGLILTVARLIFPWMKIISVISDAFKWLWSWLPNRPAWFKGGENADQLRDSLAAVSYRSTRAVASSNNVVHGVFAPPQASQPQGYDVTMFQ